MISIIKANVKLPSKVLVLDTLQKYPSYLVFFRKIHRLGGSKSFYAGVISFKINA